FFFQAEDGIRDLYVTGVQTCALPIWITEGVRWGNQFLYDWVIHTLPLNDLSSIKYEAVHATCLSQPSFYRGEFNVEEACDTFLRSEERRVGKECRSRGGP